MRLKRVLKKLAAGGQLSSPDILIASLCQEMTRFWGDQPAADDVTMVAIQFRGETP